MFTRLSFKRLVLSIVLFLIVISGILMLAIWQQGPRIHRVQFDPQALVTDTGQQIALQANQPLSKITTKQITVTPKVVFAATSGGTTILIRFGERLQYDTPYTIIAHTSHGEIRYSFRTTEAPFYYITKGDTSTTIHQRYKAEDKVVFTGKVSDYIAVGNTLAVSVQDSGANKRLFLVDIHSHKQKEVTLPTKGMIENLRAAPNRQSFGLTFTASDVHSAMNKRLLLYDMHTGKLKPVTGFDRVPLEAADWQYAPNSKTLAVQIPDTSILLVDSTGQQPTAPLGQFSTLEGFSWDASQLILGDLLHDPLSVDRKTLQQTLIASTIKSDAYLTRAIAFNTRAGFIAQLDSASGINPMQQLIRKDDTAQKELFAVTGKSNAYITGTTLSPNDSYIAVEESANNGNVSTKIISVASGKILQTIPGSAVHW